MKLGTLSLAALLVGGLSLAGCVAPPDETPAATAADDAPVAPAGLTGVAYQAPAPGLFDANLSPPVPVTPSFPLPVGLQRTSPMESFEPTIGVTSDGAVFLSTFQYHLPTGISLLQRTTDGGLTWEDVTPMIGPVTFPPQSNDPYVHVDPDTDRIFLSDLQALVCSTLSFSDDGGNSWTPSPLGCGLPGGGQDHQTIFTAKPRTLTTVDYPNLVYYCINRVADSSCATSVNGGLSFGPLRPLVFNGAELCSDPSPENPFPNIAGGLHAHGAAAPDGTAYVPKGHCGYPRVAITQDDGLTWDVVTISATVPSAGHEVPFAVDEAGHAYAMWISSDELPYLAVSEDGGRTWNEPIMVAPPGVKSARWPTIAAGADGRVAMAYYGTTFDLEEAKDGEITWNGYLTVLTDALSESPVIASATINDPADPLARGQCSGRCDGVGDFIDVVIDVEGRPWAAFVDVCNEDCVTGKADGNRGAFGVAGTLAAGPRLRGALEALPELPAAAPAASGS